MTYPTFGAIFRTVEIYIKVRDVLHSMGFNTNITHLGPFICDGVNHIGYEDVVIPPGIEVVSEEDFLERVLKLKKDVDDFIDSLEPGSQVIICERVGEEYDYPMSFVAEMTQYSGKVMTIKYVSQNDGCNGRQFSNGSDKIFYMVEDKQYYTWHSSMFELGLVNSVQHIDLTPIDVNLSTIL